MNEIKNWTFDGSEVRTVEVNGEPYFVGKDVAAVLGYQNPNEAIVEHIDDDDKLNSKTLSSFNLNLGQRGGWLINESGLYALILSSKLPTAKKFKRWVTSEVLPTIRKHGAYMTADTIKKAMQSPDFIIQLATELKSEQEKNRALSDKIEADKPKTIFADAVSVSHTSILIGDLAKLIRQNGVDIGQKRLFAWLRENGYLMKTGSSYNMPTQRAMDSKLFEVKETVVTHADGHTSINRTPKVTGKGQIFFINKFIRGDNNGSETKTEANAVADHDRHYQS